MFAVIKTGGKQYIVHAGDKIKTEKLNAFEGDEVVFNDVLLVADEEVKNHKIGMPHVKESAVKGTVLKHAKGKKLIVYKYKPKKRYDRKIGHRQNYTEVQITEIVSKQNPS